MVIKKLKENILKQKYDIKKKETIETIRKIKKKGLKKNKSKNSNSTVIENHKSIQLKIGKKKKRVIHIKIFI